MKTLLTGITGNLGHEVAIDLSNRDIGIIPITRSDKTDSFLSLSITFPEIIECDLLATGEIIYEGDADCIVHCAGNIHFRKAGDTNQIMMKKLIKLAKKLQIPLYYVSTAYASKPIGATELFNNSYEEDKFRSEQLLLESGVASAIFRPAVLVGNSQTGEIQNFSGYYTLVKGFYQAATHSKLNGYQLRFPNIPGRSNLVPTDQAAHCIADAVQNGRLTTMYIANPHPPAASWVLNETINFFNLKNDIEILDLSFEDYGKLDLTNEERALYEFNKHYLPYWSNTYDFSPPGCTENLINHNYMVKILTFFSDSQISNHG